MRTHYRFGREWVVQARPDAVLALLEDVPGYGAWWPAVRVLGDRSTRSRRAAELEVRAPAGYGIRFTLTESVTAQEVEARARLLRLASPLLHHQLAAQHERLLRAAEQGMRRALDEA